MTVRMLPEWHPQSAIQLAWPHNNTDWAPWLDEIEAFYIELTSIISQYQTVLIAADPSINWSTASHALKDAGVNLDHVKVYQVETNDTWARDHGPISVANGKTITLLDFEFDAWGGKFEANLDNLINRKLASLGAYKTELSGIDQVLEGGGIETDGNGTLLSTKFCLGKRFASIEQAEALLSKALGVERFLWLDSHNLAGDDTDAHIDTLARFVDASTIAYVKCSDSSNPHYDTLAKMEVQLKGFVDSCGNPYRLIALPMPDAIANDQGEPLPATYANFLITNEQILVPVYGAPQDTLAIQQIEQVAGRRQVLAINCRTAIEQFGSLHCLTMQLPEGVA